MNTNISLRIYMILCLVLMKLRLWAQDFGDDDDFALRDRGDIGRMEDLDALSNYHPLRFKLSDILMILLLIAGCYVFGKIWKGCIYLLLAFAALMYFMTH